MHIYLAFQNIITFGLSFGKLVVLHLKPTMLLLTFPHLLPKWTRPDQQVKIAEYGYQSWICVQQTIYEAQGNSSLYRYLVKKQKELHKTEKNELLSGVYITNPFLATVGRAYITCNGASKHNPQISMEHEGIHWILGKLKETYGSSVYYRIIQSLVSVIPFSYKNELEQLVLQLGVLEDSPLFNEEIIAVLHDLVCDPTTVRQKYHHRWNFQKLWNKVVKKAQNVTVRDIQTPQLFVVK